MSNFIDEMVDTMNAETVDTIPNIVDEIMALADCEEDEEEDNDQRQDKQLESARYSTKPYKTDRAYTH